MKSGLKMKFTRALRHFGGKTYDRQVALDGLGLDRLVLRYRRLGPIGSMLRPRTYAGGVDDAHIARRFGAAFDFEALSWERQAEQHWRTIRTISASDFESGSANELFVIQIAQFSAETGRAIIEVGEVVQLPSANGFSVQYSWREWDIARNVELSVLQKCGHPAEPYRRGA